MSFTYFAYGSNLLPARLLARCPSARVIGPARAPGHRLVFTKPGRDGSGKATLTADPKANTPGVLYRIALTDQPALHAAEGANLPNGYSFHDDFWVDVEGTGSMPVCTYLARRSNPALHPFDWYLALVVAGAVWHVLDTAHVEYLKSSDYQADRNDNSPIRQAAINAFTEAGIDGYQSMLSGA